MRSNASSYQRLTTEAGSSAITWFPSAYECLRDLAARRFDSEAPGHTLQPTALLHDAYIRLAESGYNDLQDKTHFFAMAAKVLRDILVDHARRKKAAKRGGHWQRLTLTGIGQRPSPDPIDILSLDEALRGLADTHARSAHIVELKYFGGLTNPEIATYLNISIGTVKLDWRFARAWLKHKMGPTQT